MNFRNPVLAVVFVCLTAFPGGQATGLADVVEAAADGFRIRIVQLVPAGAEQVSDTMVREFSKWWDASHSYSGDGANLSLDLEQRCMLETLPDGGFVRHLEIVYYQPGKALRLSGGLGPLQEMGVTGALTITLSEVNGKTQVQVIYNVHGYSGLQLDKIAPAVDRVLTEQFARLGELCE